MIKETKIKKSSSQKMPPHTIISFLEINLKHKRTHFLLFLIHVLNHFLTSYNGIIRGSLARNKTTLERANHLRQERSKPINENLSDQLQHNIAQTDGVKLVVQLSKSKQLMSLPKRDQSN